jgi:hypothetical protein
VRVPISIGRLKSSTGSSRSEIPCTSASEMALKEMSMLPAFAATAAACSVTARSSVASTTAASAAPPAAAISSATAATGTSVRPTRNTAAPSRAKARATARPMSPAAP